MALLGTFSASLLRRSADERECAADNEKELLAYPKHEQRKQNNYLAAKLQFSAFVVIVFIGAALMSCVAPFFPIRAMQREVSQTLVGLIMGSAPIVGFISSWIFAVFMFQIGVKFLLTTGMFLTGGCAVLFGLIDFCPPGNSFTILSFILRSFEGLGLAMYFNSCYTMSGILFADNYAFAMGIMETSTSLGTLLGPSIGGALYAAGGYFLPFVVLGGSLILLDSLAIVMIPADLTAHIDVTADEHNPLRAIRKMVTPLVLITTFTMLAATTSWIFTETTLGVRLEHFGVTDPLIVGAIYLASSGAYAISAPLLGRIADRFNNSSWIIIFAGTLLLIFGYLILGPSPILFALFIPEGLPQLIAACLCTHSGLAAVVVPTTKALQQQAELQGLDPNAVGTLAFISSAFQASWFLGGFIGSTISSALMEHVGYGWATTVQAGIVLSSLLLQIFAFIFSSCKIPCFNCRLNKQSRYSSLD